MATQSDADASKLEIDRLTKVYRAYHESESIQAQWNEQNPGNRAILEERQLATKKLLNGLGFLPLKQRDVLDIGCGSGRVLASLLELGPKPENLYGIDLLPDRIEEARRHFPDLHLECANAERLDFQDASFDLILLFTVFSSILDAHMGEKVATEVYRLLKPGGAVLWYDFRFNNPRNPHVRGMTKRHIRSFFPRFQVHLDTITLLPPLSRRLGRLTPVLYPLLSSIPILRTHYLGLLIKPNE